MAKLRTLDDLDPAALAERRVFLRVDFESNHREMSNDDTIVIGARYLLDLI